MSHSRVFLGTTWVPLMFLGSARFWCRGLILRLLYLFGFYQIFVTNRLRPHKVFYCVPASFGSFTDILV